MTAGSAQWIAAVRARESERPDRLFTDPFARELAGPLGFDRMAASERATGGENQFLPVRVRWFDDVTTEGLFFYLTEDLIARMLGETARLSGPGSRVAADVMSATGLDSPAMRPYRAWCERNGTPPPFGSDNPVGLLSGGGWGAVRVTAPGAPDANYGRLPRQPPGVIRGRVHLVIGAVE